MMITDNKLAFTLKITSEESFIQGSFVQGDMKSEYDALKEALDQSNDPAGMLECVSIKTNEVGEFLMWLDENGKYKNLVRNEIATFICHSFKSIFAEDWIAGNVIFTGPSDHEGNSTGLTPRQLNWLMRFSCHG
jgi:hypothetical protein